MKHMRSEKGESLVEYVLLVTLIALVVIAVVVVLRPDHKSFRLGHVDYTLTFNENDGAVQLAFTGTACTPAFTYQSGEFTTVSPAGKGCHSVAIAIDRGEGFDRWRVKRDGTLMVQNHEGQPWERIAYRVCSDYYGEQSKPCHVVVRTHNVSRAVSAA